MKFKKKSRNFNFNSFKSKEMQLYLLKIDQIQLKSVNIDRKSIQIDRILVLKDEIGGNFQLKQTKLPKRISLRVLRIDCASNDHVANIRHPPAKCHRVISSFFNINLLKSNNQIGNPVQMNINQSSCGLSQLFFCSKQSKFNQFSS